MLTVKKIEEILINDSRKMTIVLPEGSETKIQQVASMLVNKNIANPILIFNNATDVPTNLDQRIQVVVMEQLDKTNYINQFMQIRGDKTDLASATKLMNIAAYIGAMMVKNKQADSMLCGLTFTTADTIRPALQIIGINKAKVSLAASVFIMNKGDENYFFTDCALNIKPNSNQLADITKMVVDFAKNLDVQNPEAVLLSYSTNGSGAGEDVDKVSQAVKILAETNSDFVYAGEMQFDAAFDKVVRDKKFPNNKLTKQIPDVFVFPDINAANIGYKIAQRMGGYEAIGPFILGFNQPVNDLSRGATLDDIYNTAIMTIYQSKGVS